MESIRLKRLKKDNAVRSAAISLCIKPISLLLSIIYTPLLLQYLGSEKYGVWATILSVISWINYCDIGIGNGLRNILTRELTHKQYEKAKNAISTAYICLSFIMGTALFFLTIITFAVDWRVVFNTQYDVQLPLYISFVFICINFVLALCNNVLFALQRSEITSVKSVCVQTLNILGVCVLKRISDGNLTYLAILFGASSFLVHGTTSMKLFKVYSGLSPSIAGFDKNYVKSINGLGLKFFIAQIAALVLYTTDNLMVSNMFGAAQVTPFSLADKVFNTGYMVFSAIVVPFWSKTTQEFERGNFAVIRKYFRGLNYVAICFSGGCIIVAVFFRPIINIWLGKNMEFSNALIWIMCIYYSVYAFCGVSSQFINGMNGVNGVMTLGIIQAILNIPLSIFFAKGCRMGIVGIRFGTFVVVVIGAIFQIVYFYLLIKKRERE